MEARLVCAIEAHAQDGGTFRRAFFMQGLFTIAMFEQRDFLYGSPALSRQ